MNLNMMFDLVNRALFLTIAYSLPLLGAEQIFEKKKDSFFEPVAEYVDSSKGLIYIQKDGLDLHDKGTPESRRRPIIKFYDNPELKGEHVARFERSVGMSPYSRFFIDGKNICNSKMLNVYKTETNLGTIPVPFPHIHCQTDFYIFRSNKRRDHEHIFFNIEVLNLDKGLFSVVNNGKKLYAAYKYLNMDYVPSIDERRNKFETCLDALVKKGIRDKAIKAQNCIKTHMSGGRKFAIEKCDEKGMELSQDMIWDQEGAVSGKSITGKVLSEKEVYEKALEVGLQELIATDFKTEMNPILCEYYQDQKKYGVYIPVKSVLNNCFFMEIQVYDSSVQGKKIKIHQCVDGTGL